MTYEKNCTRCGHRKPASEFYRRAASHDGLAPACKACQKPLDHARQNTDAHRKSVRDYQRTRRGKERHAVANGSWRSRYPERRRAHNAVNHALARGKLFRDPCEVCGSWLTAAHHDDYSKPLELRWLCDEHHKLWHATDE